MFEDVLQVFGVTNDDARGERGHRDLKCLVAMKLFTLHEPGEELLSLLEEHKTVPYTGPRIRRAPKSGQHSFSGLLRLDIPVT